VVCVASGGHHSLALTKSGKVYGWGETSQYQLASEELEKIKQKPIEIKLD
jgi:alpha-tubulin suppressor-like RCC1 family protein